MDEFCDSSRERNLQYCLGHIAKETFLRKPDMQCPAECARVLDLSSSRCYAKAIFNTPCSLLMAAGGGLNRSAHFTRSKNTVVDKLDLLGWDLSGTLN